MLIVKLGRTGYFKIQGSLSFYINYKIGSENVCNDYHKRLIKLAWDWEIEEFVFT